MPAVPLMLKSMWSPLVAFAIRFYRARRWSSATIVASGCISDAASGSTLGATQFVVAVTAEGSEAADTWDPLWRVCD